MEEIKNFSQLMICAITASPMHRHGKFMGRVGYAIAVSAQFSKSKK
jgi:hypothetical protein